MDMNHRPLRRLRHVKQLGFAGAILWGRPLRSRLTSIDRTVCRPGFVTLQVERRQGFE